MPDHLVFQFTVLRIPRIFVGYRSNSYHFLLANPLKLAVPGVPS